MVDINTVLKKYDHLIVTFAKKADFDNYEDIAQDMRIYIFNHFDNYDPLKSPLDFYMKIMIKTSYRKAIYDKKRQEIFEGTFSKLGFNDYGKLDFDTYDVCMSKIIEHLHNESQKIVFYAILYDTSRKKFIRIAEHIRMPYPTFMNHLKKIRVIVQEVMKDYH